MEKKFTNGEWSQFKQHEFIPERFKVQINIGFGTGCYVHLFAREIEEMEANAKLIASAPDLLEALELTHQAIKDLMFYCTSNHLIDVEDQTDGIKDYFKATNKAYEAIKKALE